MLLTVLFTFTFVVFIFAGWLALRVANSADSRREGARFSNNQWRLIGWGVAVLICLVGAIIEFSIIFGE